jgi:hypothetical protein
MIATYSAKKDQVAAVKASMAKTAIVLHKLIVICPTKN